METVETITKLLKVYCEPNQQKDEKHATHSKIRKLLSQVIKPSNVTILVSSLIETQRNNLVQFPTYLDLIFQHKQALSVIVKSEDAEKLIAAILAEMQKSITNLRTSRFTASNEEFSKILHLEQMLCRILRDFDRDLERVPFLSALVDALDHISKEVTLIDCLSTAAMVGLLIIKKIHVLDFVVQVEQILTSEDESSCERCADLENVFIRSLRGRNGEICQLSFIHGMLGILDNGTLMSRSSEDSVAITILRMLLDTNPCESAAKILQARSLQLWFRKVLDHIKSVSEDSDLYAELSGPMTCVMNYIFNHQDDPVDIVKHLSREVFGIALKCHRSVCPNRTTCTSMGQLVVRVFAQPWDQRGKYSLIGHIAEVFGCDSVLKEEPSIPRVLVSCSNEHSLATHSSELYGKLISLQLKNNSGDNVFYSNENALDKEFWINPVINALQSDGILRLSMVQYFIPKLAKVFPCGLLHIIQNYKTYDDSATSVLLSCFTNLGNSHLLRALRQSSNSDAGDYWMGILPISALRETFISGDDQVRLDALILLCDTTKPTESMQKQQLDLIVDFLNVNLSSQSPAFRHHMRSTLTKLYKRLDDSHYAAMKRSLRKTEYPEDPSIDGDYKCFLGTLLNLLLNRLYPGASFPRRTIVLECLADLVHWCLNSRQKLLDVKVICSRSVHTNILFFVADTFVNTKINALNVLRDAGCVSHFEESTIQQLVINAWKMSESNRPQDCATAVHIFQLLLALPDDIFSKHVVPLPCIESEPQPVVTNVKEISIMDRLLSALSEQLDIGQTSLLHVAATRPFYSTLHCVSDLLLQMDNSCMSQALLQRIIFICYAVTKLVSPIVSHASPEGHVPLGPGLSLDKVLISTSDQEQLEETIETSCQLVSRIPEYLVVCCWRSVKEASLVLGQLAKMALARRDCMQLLSVQQVVEIGYFFKKQLLESRHRGAFELASVGFNHFCDALWSNSNPEIQQLPMTWLDEILGELEHASPNLCATRRSAGLPFFLQALITSEKRSNTSQLVTLSTVMNMLVRIATEKAVTDAAGEPEDLIHALNIMRVLYRDANLGEEIHPYITHGLRCAMIGFNSQSWSVRNSSTMLFSALMQRIFGVNRSKQLTSKKNCMSSRVFFSRFNGIYEFVYDQLEAATVNPRSFHPRLYPILLLLSRLLPPGAEALDSSISLDAFIPAVKRCGSSSTHHIRVLAARALVTLTCKDRLVEECSHLIESLPGPLTKVGDHNALHGSLLQIHGLVNEMIANSVEKDAMSKVASLLLPRSWHSMKHVMCLVIRAEYMRIVELFLPFISHTEPDFIVKTLNFVGFDPRSPGYGEFVAALCSLLVEVLHCETFSNCRGSILGHVEKILQSSDLNCRLHMLHRLVDISTVTLTEVLHDDQIIRLLTNEGDGECLSLWFLLIRSSMKVNSRSAWTDTSVLSSLISIVLTSMETYPLENVVVNGLALLAPVVQCLLGVEDTQDVMAVIRASLRRLNRACRFDQNESNRLEGVRALHCLSDVMINGFAALGEDVFLLWECWFAGLWDDEEEVNKSAASLLKVFDSSKGSGKLSSAVFPHAVDLLMSTYSDVTCCMLVKQVMAWLVNGLSIQEAPITYSDVRLFDRSEMNICRDDIVFLDVLADRFCTQMSPMKQCCRGYLAESLAACVTQLSTTPVTESDTVLWDSVQFAERAVRDYRLRTCLEVAQKLLCIVPFSNWGSFSRV